MARSKKVGLAACIALTVVLASGSAAYGALFTVSLRTSVTTVTGNVVNVTVVNASTTPQAGTVSVVAVVDGVTVTASASVTLGPLQSGVISIPLPGTPSRLVGCGFTNDGGGPL
jgi:hypothetical protein